MTLTSAQIWSDYHARLFGFINRRVNNPAEAEDILQEVFLRIHNHHDDLSEIDKLQAWIYRIARNAIVDFYRRQRPNDPLPADLPADEDEPLSVYAELSACMQPMINALPEPYRHALQHTELNGETQKSLADQLGLSQSGAKSRVQRGRTMVKKMLLDCCHFEQDQNGQLTDYTPNQNACGPKCDKC